MPIRNPFTRRPGLTVTTDENARPASAAGKDVAHPGFERVDTVGSKASSALSVRSAHSPDNGEYKMSVVNDSGVYLPPSPVEKDATFHRRYLSSRSSTDTKNGAVAGEIEHFPISRESFDSYRRSFDISARSPIVAADTAPPRQSLDSRFSRLPYHRSSLAERRPAVPATAEESNFEDVGLNDENSRIHPKKRGFFAKFASDENNNDAAAAAPANGASSSPLTPPPQQQQQHTGGIASRLLGAGRKRGQSGQGAELGVMPLGDRPKTASTVVQTEVSS